MLFAKKKQKTIFFYSKSANFQSFKIAIFKIILRPRVERGRRDLWTQPKYFSKSKYLVERVFKYIEKKIKHEEAFNTHIILTKISVLLKKLNRNICNKKTTRTAGYMDFS